MNTQVVFAIDFNWGFRHASIATLPSSTQNLNAPMWKIFPRLRYITAKYGLKASNNKGDWIIKKSNQLKLLIVKHMKLQASVVSRFCRAAMTGGCTPQKNYFLIM